jgi:hypothetical protein
MRLVKFGDKYVNPEQVCAVTPLKDAVGSFVVLAGNHYVTTDMLPAAVAAALTAKTSPLEMIAETMYYFEAAWRVKAGFEPR